MRFIDDFICITLDEQVATQFYNRMQKGFPEYNAFINHKKTLVNFDLKDDLYGNNFDSLLQDGKKLKLETKGNVGVNNGAFPWCGLFINPLHLSIHYSGDGQEKTKKKGTKQKPIMLIIILKCYYFTMISRFVIFFLA